VIFLGEGLSFDHGEHRLLALHCGPVLDKLVPVELDAGVQFLVVLHVVHGVAEGLVVLYQLRNLEGLVGVQAVVHLDRPGLPDHHGLRVHLHLLDVSVAQFED
jgi:hypothetical protein